MGFGSSIHAVDYMRNKASLPTITATFSAHGGVAQAAQAASIAGAVKESQNGLKAIGNAREALVAQMGQQAQERGESFSMADFKGPSLTGEILKGAVVAGATAIDAGLGAAIGAATAVQSAFQPTGGQNNTVSDAGYEASSFRSSFESKYTDAMGGVWGADGYAATPEPSMQPSQQQKPAFDPYLLQAAQSTIEEMGEKQVAKDLALATKTEQMLEAQLGATMQFAEQSLEGPKGHAQGPKPPAMGGPGMGLG